MAANGTSKVVLQTVAALVVLGGGLSVGIWFALSRTPPERQTQASKGPLVEAIAAEKSDLPVIVRGNGTVRAKVQVQVVPQVSGRVIKVHAALVSGGFFRADEPLIGIDPTDYDLALEQAEANVAQTQASRAAAEANVAESNSVLVDAQEELERLEALEGTDSIRPQELRRQRLIVEISQARLKARQSQRQAAVAAYLGAQVALRKAQVDQKRTTIKLPFDGRVVSEQVDVGQYVIAGQSVATVYGTSAMEIPVPLEDQELKWFDLPESPGLGLADGREVTAPEVTVSAEFAEARHTWTGRAMRTEGEIDAATRMVHVIVEVADSFEASDGRPPLVPGMYVTTAIVGRTITEVIPVPRHALHEVRGAWRDENGKQRKVTEAVAWLAEDGKLHKCNVTVVYVDQDRAYVSEGIDEGAVVITTPLDVATEGMTVRTSFEDETTGDKSEIRNSKSETNPKSQ